MKIRKIVGVAAASLALLFGFAEQAQAAQVWHVFTTGDAFGSATGYSGRATFAENGDGVTICDIDADGYAVRIHVYQGGVNGTRLYYFSVGGEDNCTTKSASDGGVYNLPENTTIGFRFCRYKNGEDSECSGQNYVNDN